MENVYLALIVAVPALLSPLFLSWLTNRNQQKVKELDAELKRREKLEDYARQDEVAERLVKQQNAAVAKVAEVAESLRVENRIVAETTKTTNEKLDVIHVLVNSNMTASMQGELNALRIGLTQMREIIELKKAAGLQPTPEVQMSVGSLMGKIAELEAQLADRLKQSKVADKTQEAAKK